MSTKDHGCFGNIFFDSLCAYKWKFMKYCVSKYIRIFEILVLCFIFFLMIITSKYDNNIASLYIIISMA